MEEQKKTEQESNEKSAVVSKPVETKQAETKAPVAVAKPSVEKPAPKPQDDFKHIIRIANVDLTGDKPIKISLKKIKGVGFNLASAVCNITGIDKNKKTGTLTDEEIKKLTDVLTNPKDKGIPSWMFNRKKDYETGEDKHLLIGDLDYALDNTIKRLRKIKSYVGVRHSRRLPVRGQRTKANFRKSKGKVVGVAKKKASKSGK